MSRPDKLRPEDLQAAVAKLAGWAIEHDKLHKIFVFADFVQAFGWMTAVALEAEKLDHHPNWTNVYKTVEVELWTHDVGGVTTLDLELAEAMNRHVR